MKKLNNNQKFNQSYQPMITTTNDNHKITTESDSQGMKTKRNKHQITLTRKWQKKFNENLKITTKTDKQK